MKIYGSLGSTCTRRVLTVFAEKAANYELIPIDLSKGEHKQAAHYQRHPFGVIPVLEEDDGFRLYESRAIMHYLDLRLPGIELTPKSVHEHGLMAQWISVEASYFSSPSLRILKQLLWSNQPPDNTVISEAQKEIQHVLAVLEPVLKFNVYLAGEDFSLADITYMPYFDYLLKVKAMDLSAYPAVQAWWERISQRPSWIKVAQGQQK